MRKTVKKLVSILGGLLLLTILTVSCNGWMQDDGFMENIEDEVSVANADRIATYVRYPNTKMGTTSPSGDAILKVNVPMDITATTNTEYGFYKWAAFKKGTDEGEFDTSKQNSSLYYKSVEYYEENYAQYELPSSVVEFVDPTAESTSVKIKEKRNDVVIVPIVVERPFYTASVPANGKSDVVLNQAIRILMSKAISGEKLAENIKITAGTAVFTEDTEDSDAEDITDRFDITLSKTGKMITCKLKSTDGENTNLMPTKSQITVTIYSDLKDTLGYTMEENQKIIFQTGSVTDTLAPKYVDNPKAGINELAKDFVFMGPKGSREALDSIFATTFNEYKTIFKDGSKYLKPLEDSSYAADTKDEDAKFVFTNYLRHRVYDKLNIVVRAADLAGSGTKADEQSAVEDDVAFIKIRSKLVRDPNNTPVTTEYSANGTIGYQAGGIDKSDDYAYKGNLTLAQATGAEEGTLFTYNLDSLLDADKNIYKLTDGLVRIDLWTVDMIGNEGKDDNYWSNWDNGLRTLYVVKDQTPPVITTSSITSGSAAIAVDEAKGTKAYAAVSNNWYNPITFKNIKIAANAANAVVDPGYVDPTNPEINYAAYKNDLQWTIKINPAEDWNPATETTSWKKIYITSDSKNNVTDYEKYDFTNASVSADGVVNIKVAAKDDLGNVSAPVALGSVYYDSVNPIVKSLSWTAGSGTAGVTTGNVLTDQTLNIQLNESTAGVQKVKIEVQKTSGGGTATTKPFTKVNESEQEEALSIAISYTPEQGEKKDLIKGIDYSITGDTLTFNPQNNYSYLTSGLLTIKGIKINDNAATAEGLYKVTVTVTDGAQNSGAESVEAIDITNDSTKPEVEEIVISGIKKSSELITAGISPLDGSSSFWLDSKYVNPSRGNKGEVTVIINESNSGVQVIEFGGTAKLTDKSKLYTVTSNGNIEVLSTLYTVNTTNNSIKINKSEDSLKNQNSFKILVDNIEFATNSNGSSENNIKVIVTDVALNKSDETDPRSTHFKYGNDSQNYLFEKFWIDSVAGGISGLYLEDTDTMYKSAGNHASTSGYTNNRLITVSAILKLEGANSSGYNKFVLSGATFTDKTELIFGMANTSEGDSSAHLNKSDKYYADYDSEFDNYVDKLVNAKDTQNAVYNDKIKFIVTNNGTTLELRESVTSSDYYVFRNYTTVRFTNVQLDIENDGATYVSLLVDDLAGWNTGSGTNTTSSIILDTTKPEIRRTPDAVGEGHGLFTFSGTGNSDCRVSSIANPATFVYPHSGSTEGVVLDTNEKNGDGKQIHYFYVSAQSIINESDLNHPIYGTTANPSGNVYGVALGIGVADNSKIKNSSSDSTSVGYYIYKHGSGDVNSTLTAEQILSETGLKGTLLKPSDIGKDILNKPSKTGREIYTNGDPYNRQWFPLYGQNSQTYSVILVDEAGNYSLADTFVVVKDVTRPSIKVSNGDSLSTTFTITTPAESKVFRNSSPSVQSIQQIDSRKCDDLYDDYSHQAVNYYSSSYVIKKTAERVKIKINLNGIKTSELASSETYLDGGTIVSDSSAYSEVVPRTSDSGLESYSISHWYADWTASGTDSASYLPAYPATNSDTPNDKTIKDYFGWSLTADDGGLSSKASWHAYKNNSGNYYDDDLKSYVDASGNIVVELRNDKDTPPLALLLKDHCGNLNYILIRPTSMETDGKQIINFIVDDKIGEGLSTGRNIGMNTYMAETQVASHGLAPLAIKLNGEPLKNADNTVKQFYWGHRTSSYQPGSATLTSGVTGIGVIAPDVESKTTYYNDNAYLGLYNKAESITFASAYRHGTAPSDGQYTLRARVRAWDETGDAPKRDDFAGDGATGADLSSWVYLRDVSSSGNNDYVLQYPHPTRTEKFRLYYYVEDAVGNYEINTVVNDSANEMVYWMYDNAGPSVLTRSGKKPSDITGAQINELIASNNGFTPHRISNTVYIAKTDKKRTGYSLPAQSEIGRGVTLGSYNNGLKWGNYFDLDITEISGIRAFTYTTTTDHPPAYTATTGCSMGDAEATGKWYCEDGVAINQTIGSSVSYNQSSTTQTMYTASDGEVRYDYYLPSYGSNKYSGVKVCETIPWGLVDTTATDLYLHVMDWVGNITTVRLGTGALGVSGIKWAADVEPDNDNNGTIDEHMPGWRIQSYNGEDNIKNDLHYTIAATKIASNATSLKIYFPEGHFNDAGSGLLGWSLTPDDKTSIKTDDQTDYKKSYIEITGTKLSSLKSGSEAGTTEAYVYDNLGWSHKVVLKLTGDAVLPNMTPYIRGVKSGAYVTSFIKESMHLETDGVHNYNNPVGNECISSTLYNTEAEIAAKARTVYTIGETAVFLFNSPSGDNYNATVSHWNGSKWVLDADLLTEKHGEGVTNWWVEDGWYSSKQIKDFSSGSYYRYTVIDNNGNENYAYIKLIKDTAAPAITIVKDAVTGKDKIQNVNQIEVSGTKKNYFNNQATVTLQYTDTESGIYEYPGLASPYTSYVTTTPEFEYTLKDATITSGVIKIAGATDNLRQSADAELKYNNVGYWVYDTTAPAVSSLTTQTAEYNIWWKPSNNIQKSPSTNFEITETTIPDGENQYKAKLTATKSSTSSTNVSTSGVKKFNFKPASASTDLLGWLVQIVDSSATENPPAFTAANDITIAKDAYYEFASVPADDKKCFFYPIDYAGNAGSPYVLTFAAAVTPNLTYINAKSEGKDASNNIIKNFIIQQKDPSNPGSTQNYYYYNKNSRITVSVKNPSNKDPITVKSFTIEFKDSSNNSNKKDFTLAASEVITKGETVTFTLPLDGMCGTLSEIGGPINKQYFTVYVNTEFASSNGRQFSSTPFIYEGTGPESISISSVESQSGNSYVRKDDGTTVSYGNNATKIIITPDATDTVGVAGYSSEENGTYGSTVEFTTASLPATPKIWAKDNLGNVSSQDITLTIDNSVSDVSDITIKSPDSGSGVYYDSVNKIVYANQEVRIAVTKVSDADNPSYTDGTTTSADGEFTYTPGDSDQTISFTAVDPLGNESANPYVVTLRKDSDKPTGALSYTLTDGSTTATSDYYYSSTDNGVTSIVYNPTNVKVFELSESTPISDTGVGLVTNYLVYTVDNGTDKTAIENNKVTITTGKTYRVYAVDKVGNTSDCLLALSFTEDSTPIALSTTGASISGSFGAMASGVDVSKVEGVSNSIDNKSGNDDIVGNNFTTQFIPSNSTFTVTVVGAYSDIAGYGFTIGNTAAVFTAPTTFTSITPAKSFAVVMPDITEAHSYVFLWIKDKVGNLSYYNICNSNMNWWLTQTNPESFNWSVSGNTITLTGLKNVPLKSIEVTGATISSVEFAFNITSNQNTKKSYSKNSNISTDNGVSKITLSNNFAGEDKITITVDNGSNVSAVNVVNVYSDTAVAGTPSANINLVSDSSLFEQVRTFFGGKKSIAPTAATTTTAPKTKVTKTKKSKAAKAPVVQELPTESFAEMPTLESVDVLGALERSSNANSSADGIAAAGKAVEIVKQQAENLTAEPKAAASGVMGSETHAIESSEADKRNVLPIIIILGVCLSLGLVFAFFMTKKKNTRS